MELEQRVTRLEEDPNKDEHEEKDPDE